MVPLKISSIRSKRSIAILSLIIAAGLASSYPLSIIAHRLLYFNLAIGGPGGASDAYIIDAKGFLVDNIFNKGGGEYNPPKLNEFLLMPGSTGYITINYDYTRQGSIQNHFESFHVTPKEYVLRGTRAIDLLKLNDFSGHQYLSQNSPGINIHPTNITFLSRQVMQVTFAITAEPSAQRGTFGLPLLDAGTQFLTVGYWPYIY
jgi:hypothetical protein